MKILLVLTAAAWAMPQQITLDEEWNEYKKSFGKFYTSVGEDVKRLNMYVATKQRVEEHNRKYEKGETSYSMEINNFADWFPEELDKLNGFKPELDKRSEAWEEFELPPGGEVPEEMNWVKKGAVTSVKNQGHCGSCYAFSAVGALEGLMFSKNKTIEDLSVQELVDCSTAYNNSGCNGGIMNNCFQYVEGRKGISTDHSYPYEGEEGSCRASDGKFGASCTGYKDVAKDEESLKQAVGTIGPISIGFAVGRELFFYKKGIFDGDCAIWVNHGMLLVGYGKDEETNKDYWLVKNSWGRRWGIRGYLKVIRGVNKCNITSFSSYPVYSESGL